MEHWQSIQCIRVLCGPAAREISRAQAAVFRRIKIEPLYDVKLFFGLSCHKNTRTPGSENLDWPRSLCPTGTNTEQYLLNEIATVIIKYYRYCYLIQPVCYIIVCVCGCLVFPPEVHQITN